MYDGETVVNTSKIFITEEEIVEGGEDGLLFRQSTLQICDARIRDSGNYICVVSNGVDSVNASTQLALSGK